MALDATLISQPNDTDLDIHLHDMQVTSVTAIDSHWVVTLAGGYGRLGHDDNGAAHDDATSVELTVTFGFHPHDTPNAASTLDQLGAQYTERLDRWHTEHTPLEVCGAPGRAMTIIEHPGCWLYVPQP